MKCLKIMTWNANGLIRRKNELKVVLEVNNIDICLVSETHFTRDSYCKIGGYKLYHALHPSNKARGGSAVIIKENFSHHEFAKIETEMFQICAIEVKMASYSTTLASIYIPPRHIVKEKIFEDVFGQLGNRFIIGGDFNAKNTYWGSRVTTERGRELYQYLSKQNCDPHTSGTPTYWPTDPTKLPDLIDFFITKNISANYLVVEDCHDLSSDHSPIILSLSDWVIQKPHRPVLANKHTNWDNFKVEVNQRVVLSTVLDTEEDIDHDLTELICNIQTAASNSTPAIRKRLKGINYPREILAAIKEKRKARKRWQATRAPAHKAAWYKATNELRQMMKEINDATNEDFVTSLTNHRDTDYSLWKATKHLKRPTVQAPPIKKQTTGEWVRTNQEKADVFADYLANIFTPNPGEPNEEPLEEIPLCEPETYIPLVTVKEVQRTIQKEINPKKAPGYDLITGQILKYLPRKIVVKITQIINAAIKLRHVPQLWKIAEVIMIPKPGKPANELTSYRPISLLPVLSKLFEKLIHRRLLKIIDERKLIPKHQFGFRKQHSTIDQVHRIISVIERALEEKKVCSAIFLDVTQAFDKVWHKGLNYKLRKLLPACYAKLLQSYLTDRYFRIKQDDAFSEPKMIQAGVPQGSVLGPLLYLLYTCDLPETEENTTATFADDTAVLAIGETNLESVTKLNLSISRIHNWTTKWRIRMNEAKSVHVDFTNKKINYVPACLNDKVIPYANEAKYLGMTLDAKLRWKAHVKKKKAELVVKFRKMYWLMGRRSKMSIHNKLILYKQVLKPVWAYGAHLWGCTAQSNRDIIQRFQNNVLRCCVDAYRYFRNDRLHYELQIESVNEVIRNQAINHLVRLRDHVNEDVVRLLDTDDLLRRLKRTKPHELVQLV